MENKMEIGGITYNSFLVSLCYNLERIFSRDY